MSNNNNPKHSSGDWISLIEKVILAILGFLTGYSADAMVHIFNF